MFDNKGKYCNWKSEKDFNNKDIKHEKTPQNYSSEQNRLQKVKKSKSSKHVMVYSS